MRSALPDGPCLVAGLGRAGCAAVDALLRSGGHSVSAWDASDSRATRATARRLRERGVVVGLGGDGRAALDAAGPDVTVVKSPGIFMHVPLVLAAHEHGVAVIDELELGWRLTAAPTVGVTGTNGKSTTSQLCRAVLEGAGHTVELAGNTEFGAPLSAASSEGWIVCEVSSFQLEAAPTFRPDIAVFTNLTPDHLDRHGTMAAYGAAKQAMFVAGNQTAGTSVINVDDIFGRELAAAVRDAGGRVLGYGFDPAADVQIVDASWEISAATTRLRGADGEVTLTTRLPGRHNALNLAAAFAVGEAAGIAMERTAAALGRATPPPGRWELVDEGQPFDVVVDYAHTPDGIRQLLEAVRSGIASRDHAEVCTVFGPVGVPDPDKERESGLAAGELSDRLIVTTGSAGADARMARIADVVHGAPDPDRVGVVLDRKEAIAHAIEGARPGDVVVLAGLGHLRRQLLDAHTRSPHNDGDAARDALRSGARAWS
jgi:UDP-N-acetylmuramoyl-L-alanyl-D-glutamate--2,6-diaminopimelate ligase